MTLTPKWLNQPETQTLIAAFKQTDVPLRFVGGCVRDSLLGKEVHDIDAATTLPPEQVVELLEQANIKAIPTGIAHGTITAVIDKKPFEITTLRKDVATDGRHAEVEYTGDWQQDAQRRDFTMNALYLSPEGEVFDYHDGEKDARAGRVIFIGDATKRIEEDYLRILRFFRFFAHYGKSTPDKKAMEACTQAAAQIETLSAERIGHEMLKLLSAKRSHHALSFMADQNILPHVVGFNITSRAVIRRLEEMNAAFSHALPATAKLAALLLVADQKIATEEVATRLRLSNADTQRVKNLLALQESISTSLSFPQQKRLIRKESASLFCEAVLLAWAQTDELIDTSHPYHGMLTLAQEWKPPVFPVSGDDLKALGLKEGKAIGRALAELEEAWEQDDYKMSRGELLKRIEL